MRTKLPLVALSLLMTMGCQREQSWPNRPITLICPWSAGGGTDRVSRQLAVGLERELGVPVNVVNATGGGGVTGHSRGALARPDGYTLTTITPELTMLHWRGMTNITYRDFEPLMSVNGDYAALFVPADSKYDTIGKLEAAIRDPSIKIKASGSAFGSIWHVALAGWLTSMDLSPNDVIWVSVNGSAPSLQELLAGTIDVVCCSVPEAQTLLDSDKVRCIAVMADERLDALPKVPTLREKGADWSLSGWRGIALPKGVPADRVKKLHDALRKVVNGDEYRDFLAKAGFGHRAGEPEQFAETLADSDKKFGDIFNSEAFASVQEQRFGPMLFPIVLASLLVLTLGGLYLTGKEAQPADVADISRTAWIRIAVLLGSLLFYVLLAEVLGFLITAAVVLFVLLCTFEVRWPIALAVTVGLVAVVYQVFAVVLRVPLPWGYWGW